MNFKNLSRIHPATHKLGDSESTYVKPNQKKNLGISFFLLAGKKKKSQTFKPNKVITIIRK